jgi:hypothetical protein
MKIEIGSMATGPLKGVKVIDLSLCFLDLYVLCI